MKPHEVTDHCGRFARTLDQFMYEVRRVAMEEFIARLNGVKARKSVPYDGELCRESIIKGVQTAMPRLGVAIPYFDAAKIPPCDPSPLPTHEKTETKPPP